MTAIIRSEMPPLREDSTGALRIGTSRVLLEMVIHAFQDGATPEAIVQSYPTTTLSDVYSTIAYYLRNREAVEDYLALRENQAADVRRRIEAGQGDLGELRRRLLARQGI